MVCCQGQIAIFEKKNFEPKTAFYSWIAHRQSAIKIAKMQQQGSQETPSIIPSGKKKSDFSCCVILSRMIFVLDGSSDLRKILESFKAEPS